MVGRHEAGWTEQVLRTTKMHEDMISGFDLAGLARGLAEFANPPGDCLQRIELALDLKFVVHCIGSERGTRMLLSGTNESVLGS